MHTADIPARRATVVVWPLLAGAACAPLKTKTEDWLAGFEVVGSTFPARFTGAAPTAMMYNSYTS